jgi:hypothetical protein
MLPKRMKISTSDGHLANDTGQSGRRSRLLVTPVPLALVNRVGKCYYLLAAHKIPVIAALDELRLVAVTPYFRVRSHETFRKSDSARISCDQRHAGGTFSNA